MNKTEAFELALWKAKDHPDKHRDLIVESTNHGLSEFGGFINRRLYQSVDDPLLMLDWLAWDSLENATQAAQNMQQVEELQSFVSLIDKTELFEHYHKKEIHSVDESETATIELVAYELKPSGDISTFFETYSKEVTHFPGYKNRHLFQNAKNENAWVEIVHWENIETARQAVKLMEKNERLGLVFPMVEKVVLMHHFNRYI